MRLPRPMGVGFAGLPGAMRWAVLGDVHSNGAAFDAALHQLQGESFDRIVILGDVLTYGPRPRETLAAVQGLCERAGAVLLRGNHDALYLDLLAGRTAGYRALPGWLRESADWTLAALDADDRARFARLPWRDEWREEGVLFTHANPFGPGDWTYLNDDAQIHRALTRLVEMQVLAGISGHNHRRACVGLGDGGRLLRQEGRAGHFAHGSAAAVHVNPGSLGQPRDRDLVASYCLLAARDGSVDVAFREVTYDRAAYVREVAALPLSGETRRRLGGFVASTGHSGGLRC